MCQHEHGAILLTKIFLQRAREIFWKLLHHGHQITYVLIVSVIPNNNRILIQKMIIFWIKNLDFIRVDREWCANLILLLGTSITVRCYLCSSYLYVSIVCRTKAVRLFEVMSGVLSDVLPSVEVFSNFDHRVMSEYTCSAKRALVRINYHNLCNRLD